MQSGSNKTAAANKEAEENDTDTKQTEGEADNKAESQAASDADTGSDSTDSKNINSFEEGGDTDQSKADTDQGTSSQSDDSFATNFDPKNLPDELKPVYKQMQGDYTRKTQDIASQRKQYERVQQYMPLLNRVLSNQDLLNMALGRNQQGETGNQNAQNQQSEDIPDDPKKYAEWVKGQTLDEVQKQFAQQERIRQQREARQRDFQEAEKVDPRLNQDNEFQNIILGLVTSNPQFQQGQLSAVDATKQAVAFYDNYVDKLVKQKEQERVKNLKNKKHVIQDTETGSSKTSPQQNIQASMREIAKKEGFI